MLNHPIKFFFLIWSFLFLILLHYQGVRAQSYLLFTYWWLSQVNFYEEEHKQFHQEFGLGSPWLFFIPITVSPKLFSAILSFVLFSFSFFFSFISSLHLISPLLFSYVHSLPFSPILFAPSLFDFSLLFSSLFSFLLGSSLLSATLLFSSSSSSSSSSFCLSFSPFIYPLCLYPLLLFSPNLFSSLLLFIFSFFSFIFSSSIVLSFLLPSFPLFNECPGYMALNSLMVRFQ